MIMQLTADTNQPNDLAHLAIVAGAFNGAAPAAGKTAPANNSKPQADTPPAAPAASAPATDATLPRKTIAELRELCGTKVVADCKGVWAKMGYEGLSKIPAERLAEAYELVKALPNK